MIKGLYTTPSGCDILAQIASSLADVTKGDMGALRDCLILLPTRRAIRVLEEKLLDSFSSPTVLLPRIMAIGDIELPPEDEDNGKLPPRGITGLERIVSLLPYLQKHNLGGAHFDGQWRMAQEVVKLIDLLQTEDLDIDAIGKMINAADLAAHWQDNGGLFEKVARDWLADLVPQNRINAAAGRTLRIETLIEQWEKQPPVHPVWLLGSTGSIPAVRRLMKKTLSLSQGAVLLPGVDTHMGDAEWAAMGDGHPQAILRATIADLGYDRREVKFWPACNPSENMDQRHRWLSVALSPFPKTFTPDSVEDISIMLAASEQEEAESVAEYCIRHFRDAPDKSIAIIANEPAFTQRLLPLLAAYNIDLDPSAGLSLQYTGIGQAMATLLRSLSANASVIDMIQLLKRPDFAPYWDDASREKTLADIEKRNLRDPLHVPKNADDFIALFPEDTLDVFIQTKEKFTSKRRLGEWAKLLHDALPLHFRLNNLADKGAMESALDALENMSTLTTPHALSYEDALTPICDQLMRIALRKNFQTRRSVQILGTMEARLMHADIVILAGLNEGKWPDTPQPSPFMSRGMRHTIGLPDTERHAALAGHDFQQAFLMPRIVLSYAHRGDDGPLLPARWLLRLKAVTPAAIWQSINDTGKMYIEARHRRHFSDEYLPATPPAPVAAKDDLHFPLYVTHMETWRNDPYGFWAKHVAGLRKLDPFLGEINAATRGTLWHKILNIFAARYEQKPDKETLFDSCVSEILTQNDVPAYKQRSWMNRLAKVRGAFIGYERTRRTYSRPYKLEEEWEGNIGGYPFKAKADRVDITNDDMLLLLDYKTGKAPSEKDIDNGLACQLSLLAFMTGKPVQEIEYLSVSGGRKPIESRNFSWSDEFSLATYEGVTAWMKLFLEQGQPFVSLADFGKLKSRDYADLSRHSEWGMET